VIQATVTVICDQCKTGKAVLVSNGVLPSMGTLLRKLAKVGFQADKGKHLCRRCAPNGGEMEGQLPLLGRPT